MLRRSWLALILSSAAALCVAGADAQSPRNASYTIDVTLDTATRTLQGREVLAWRNIRQAPTDRLWFHLYWNAWRNDRSTWMLENRIADRRRSSREPEWDAWSWIDVDSIRLRDPAGGAPIDLAWRFVSPDDGNPDDRTVFVAELPRPVAPGETVHVEIGWRAKIPRTFARTGYRGDFYFIAQWFPKLGVYETAGWNCHQFHAATEFYSDYGVYDVRIRVPQGYVVGATGREVAREEHDDGSVTHRYVQEDVHDFAWTASPHYRVLTERFEPAGLPAVDMRLLIQPEHRAQAERHFAATRAAIEHYGRWYGPYPYGHVTIVDPAYGSGAGGMEYPTLFTCGTRRFAPPRSDAPELVTIHEMGHQFWYGLVGNNEFEHAWLDEGINTYSTIRTLEAAYEPALLVRRYFDGLLPVTFSEIEVSRWNRGMRRYRKHGQSDAPAKPTFHYYPGTASTISYSKTALWLATLERHLGWSTLQPILATFFERYRFRHPRPEDFFAVAEEVSGQDLSWFFDQVHHDSVAFDYGISRVESRRVRPRGFDDAGNRLDPDDANGEDDEADDADAEPLYRTEVVVRRFESGRFPVDVRLTFEDGHEWTVRWNGEERWKLYVVERPAKLELAQVDPDHVLMLDLDRSDNAVRRKPQGRLPALKWSGKWMLWFQDRLSTFAFFM